MPVLYGYNPITGTWGVLSEVMNGYPFATDDETTAGVIDNKAVTPSSLSPVLNLKANTTDVSAALALKADITSLNEEKLLLTQEIDALKKSAVENSNAPYLTGSDYGAVALAKNSVGVGQFGVDGVTVENAISGNFETNFGSFAASGVTRETAQADAGNYSVFFNSSSDKLNFDLSEQGFTDGDIILLVFSAYRSEAGSIAFYWQGTTSGWISSATGAWQRHALKRTYSSGNANQAGYFYFSTTAGSYLDSIIFVNLSALGLNSLTETQLKKLLSVYFDGTKTFGGIGCLVSKDSDSNEVGRQYFSTDPMYSNATLKDVLAYSDGKYYHTHNVDADGNAIATPYDTEVEVNGQFSALSNGTVTYEPWFPDIGIYTDKFTLSKAITAVKELYKYGSTTPITDAVIASNGLSFTSASLTSGDLAYGVFEFEEPLRPLITVKSRNDDATVADTTNGKIYTFRPVITNGAIASWTVTEV